MLIPEHFLVGEPVVQAAIIQAAVEIAKCIYKSEAVNSEKVANIAQDLQFKLGNLAQKAA